MALISIVFVGGNVNVTRKEAVSYGRESSTVTSRFSRLMYEMGSKIVGQWKQFRAGATAVPGNPSRPR